MPTVMHDPWQATRMWSRADALPLTVAAVFACGPVPPPETDTGTSISSGTTDDTPAASEPSPGCQVDSDCGYCVACVDNECVVLPVDCEPDCQDDADCPTDADCVEGACLPKTPDCQGDADCPADASVPGHLIHVISGRDPSGVWAGA